VPAAPARRKAGAPRRRSSRSRPATAWWGAGAPPWERWPGVTVKLEAVWQPSRRRWESRDGRYWYDAEAGQRACDFFPAFLKHFIGEFAGQPFELLDYQALLLSKPLFGWKRTEDDRRRFGKVFAFLPKGAGKSPWGAGTGIYLAICDGEPAAEVYAVAGDRQQARIVHDNARIMVEESPDLSEMCEVLRDSIYHAASRSTYKVLSSDASTKHGFRPHGIIFDELHNQKDRKLFEALTKSMKKRREPVLIMLTHAGDDDETLCYEEYDYAKKVLSGTVPDDACLPVIFEATPEEDYRNPEVWRRVNPGHGITVQHRAIAAECEEAQVEPRKLNDFLRFTLNRWVNQAVAWIPIDWWDRCREPIAREGLAELAVFGGLDMAQKHDLTAFVLLFREYTEGPAPTVELATRTESELASETVKREVSLNFRISLLPHFWIPADTMREHEQKDRVPYGQWVAQGLVTATEGNMIDYDRVFKDIVAICAPYPRLQGSLIGYDPAFASDIATRLRDKAGYPIVELRQNFVTLSESSQLFESLVHAGRVRHDGHRCLRWNVENAMVKRTDDGLIRPVKPRQQSKRVDGLLATVFALRCALTMPEETAAPSVGLL